MNSNGHVKSNEAADSHDLPDWKSDPSIFSEVVVRLGNEAVQDAIAEHHRDGRPVSIWEDGRIVLLYPDGTRRPLAEVEQETAPQAA